MVVMAAAGLCTSAAGQGSSVPVLEPSLTNPGARSLGLGGAFVALADDATAAFANPAGLVQLLRPEISAELRAWNQADAPGSISPSGIGFASFVWPRERWSLAVYGQTLASLEQPLGLTLETGGEPGSTAFNPWFTVLDLVNLGFSAAWSATEELSFGLGVSAKRGSFTASGFSLDLGSGPFQLWERSVHDSASSTGWIGGVLWSPTSSWSLGAAYRSGATLGFDLTPVGIDPAATSDLEARIPDVAAVGASWRSASGRLLVSVEWERLNSPTAVRSRLHLGGEWILDATPLMGLRLGLWRDPGVSTSGSGTNPSGGLSPPGDDVLHTAFGFGIVLRRVQLDLAFDLSSEVDTGSVSAIFTF